MDRFLFLFPRTREKFFYDLKHDFRVIGGIGGFPKSARVIKADEGRGDMLTGLS